MSGRPEQERPVVRYSDVAGGQAPTPDDDPSARPAPPADELAFRALTELKGGGLWSSSGPPASPSSSMPAPPVSPDHRSVELFGQMSREVHRIYDAVRRSEPFRVDSLFAVAESLIDHPSPAQLVAQMFEHHQHTHFERNPAHCGIIAAEIGRGLGYAKPELLMVTVAAFLHDIGLQQLPQSLLEKANGLTAEEAAAVQSHPERGYRLLGQYASKQPLLAQIVRQEHEREGGQGYPHKLRGDAILDLAKVIGITDIYDALITPRPYRRAFCPHGAIEELLDCQERLGYARHVVRALIQQLSLFPPGCLVQLSSQEIGRVIQTNSRSPLRPVVKVLYSGDRPLVSPRIVDLNDNPFVYIVASLCEDDYASMALAEASAG
jgi:hypothetical protein